MRTARVRSRHRGAGVPCVVRWLWAYQAAAGGESLPAGPLGGEYSPRHLRPPSPAVAIASSALPATALPAAHAAAAAQGPCRRRAAHDVAALDAAARDAARDAAALAAAALVAAARAAALVVVAAAAAALVAAGASSPSPLARKCVRWPMDAVAGVAGRAAYAGCT